MLLTTGFLATSLISYTVSTASVRQGIVESGLPLTMFDGTGAFIGATGVGLTALDARADRRLPQALRPAHLLRGAGGVTRQR